MTLSHCMIDLETMSADTDAAIIAIGAVTFDPETLTLGATFYQPISLEDSAKHGSMSASTVLWWMQQSEEARKVLWHDQLTSLRNALHHFSAWLGQATTCPEGEVKLWGNGSDFDNVILSRAYYNCAIPAPWKFYNNRCYRTLKSLVPATKLLRTGTHHNALDDAASQARHLLVLWEALGLRKDVME